MSPATSGGSLFISDAYPVPMRTTPTVECILSGTKYWYGTTGDGSVVTPSIVANQYYAQFVFGGLVTASGLQSLQYTADAEL